MLDTTDHSDAANNPVLTRSISFNFFSLVIPSLIGLIAFSSAAIIDGIFIGNYVGTPALAAINLIIPFINLIFGITYMLAIGGSVSAGKYIGENNLNAASGIFSKIMIIGSIFALFMLSFSFLFTNSIFAALGATPDLHELMSDYFLIRMGFIFIDVITILLYYFSRTDGRATLAAIALIVGSATNILLDYLFIVQFQWGLQGAALATGLAQSIPFIIFFTYFLTPYKKMIFSFFQKDWFEVARSCYNGLSEFINEVSISLITFILNWMLITNYGTNGVAAITIINYLLMMGIMFVISVSEAGQIFISQNFGAKNFTRIKHYFLASMLACLLISVLCICLLLGFTEFMIGLFLDENSEEAAQLAVEYVEILWPIFLVNGFSIMISAYFTGVHRAKESAMVAILRSLLLPCLFLIIFYYWVDSIAFLWALPLAEIITFFVAIVLYILNRPSLVAKATNDQINLKPDQS